MKFYLVTSFVLWRAACHELQRQWMTKWTLPPSFPWLSEFHLRVGGPLRVAAAWAEWKLSSLQNCVVSTLSTCQVCWAGDKSDIDTQEERYCMWLVTRSLKVPVHEGSEQNRQHKRRPARKAVASSYRPSHGTFPSVKFLQPDTESMLHIQFPSLLMYSQTHPVWFIYSFMYFPAFDRNLVRRRRCLCWPEPVRSSRRHESLAGRTQSPITRRSVWSASLQVTASGSCICVRQFYCHVTVLSIGQMKCSFCHKSFRIHLFKFFWQSCVFFFWQLQTFVRVTTLGQQMIQEHWLTAIPKSGILTWKPAHLEVAKQFTSMISIRFPRSSMFSQDSVFLGRCKSTLGNNTVVIPDKATLSLADARLAHHGCTNLSPITERFCWTFIREKTSWWNSISSSISSWCDWWFLCSLVVIVVVLHPPQAPQLLTHSSLCVFCSSLPKNQGTLMPCHKQSGRRPDWRQEKSPLTSDKKVFWHVTELLA